jgi:hypothetical protein
MSGRCSRPQKSSPSTTSVGTPKTPAASAAARIVSCSRPAVAREICVETGRVGAGLGQHRGDHFDILDVEFAPPEALEHPVVVGAEHGCTLVLRPEHANGGDRGVTGASLTRARAMAEHKFKIGVRVYFHLRSQHETPPESYQIIKRLPAANEEFQYVFRSEYEDHQRVAKESELSRN